MKENKIEQTELIINQCNELLSFFRYAHLPEHLQFVSKPFGDLAKQIAVEPPHTFEKVAALRKLLESKDAAVRNALSPKTT